MSYPRFTLNPSHVEACGTLWPTETTTQMVLAVYEEWAAETDVETVAGQRPLKAELTRMTDGRSGANVYRLVFEELGRTQVVARFILRSVSKPEDLEREREVAKQLQQTGSEWFASSVLDGKFPVDDCIVYRHVDDAFDGVGRSLNDVAVEIIATEDAQRLEAFTDRLTALLDGITAVYRTIEGDRRLTDWSDYFSKLRPRLAPDLIIDGKGRSVVQDGSNIIVSDHIGSGPMALESVAEASIDEVLNRLEAHSPGQREWVSTEVHAGPRYEADNFLKCSAGEKQLWLRLTGAQQRSLELNTTTRYKVFFLLEPGTAGSRRSELERMGFRKAIYTPDELFGALDPTTRVTRTLQHTDLHSGNILDSGSRVKVIDIFSTDFELPYSFRARLEISLWEHLCRDLNLASERVLEVMDWVERRDSPPVEAEDAGGEAPWAVQAIGSMVRAVRGSIRPDGILGEPERLERILAYGVEGLLFERYRIDDTDPVGSGFDAVLGWWFDQLPGTRPDPGTGVGTRGGVSLEALGAADVLKGLRPSPETSVDTVRETAEHRSPTLASLWREGASSAGLRGTLGGRS